MMKSQKVRFLMVGTLMFIVAWLGYWGGYVHSTNNLDHTQEALKFNNQQFKVSQNLQGKSNNKKYVNIKKTKVHKKFKNEDSNEDDQLHVVDKEIEKEKPFNKDKDSQKHKLDIHKEYARKMSDINKFSRNQKSNKAKGKKENKGSLVEQVREKLALHELQQDDNWVQEQNQAIKQQKMEKIAKQKKQEAVINNDIHPDEGYYALIHNGKATRVHNKIHEKIKDMPDHISPDLYTLTSTQLPKNHKLMPSIGNGHIATVIHSDKVFMNGVYNGYKNLSHRAAIPSTCAVEITGTEPASKFVRTYTLNLAEGIYMEESVADQYVLTQRVYAHRNMTRLLVVEIDLIRKSLAPLTLLVKFNRWTASSDITFLKSDSFDEEVSYKHGRINAPETDDGRYTEVHLYYDHIPDKLTPPAKSLRTKWVFITAMATTQKDAQTAYKLGADLIKSNDQLYATHVEAWVNLWEKGSIHVEGNYNFARSLYSSMYYLYSSLPLESDPLWPFVGISPNGLPVGGMGEDYEGHVMWDQETWMYPPILFFHSDIGKIIINTRKRTMAEAKKLAQSRRFQGLEYPWESGFTGADVTISVPCSVYELHITGDISRAIMQYLYATNDVSAFQMPGGYADILAGIANFWVSKLNFNTKTNFYEIRDVMPPDEKAGIVNNSVYTNTIAQMSIAAMEQMYQQLGKSVTNWKRYADNIYIPFDAKLQYHPEYDRYYKGKGVKQADAILLGYPLNRKMPTNVRRNDLTFYEEATEKTGPAMTWCMYSIGWLELGEINKATNYFLKYKQYINGDFMVWTEQPKGGGATNFLTGVGGFLQNIIAGYGGFRLHSNNLEFNPVLPPGVRKLTFNDIDYLGSSFDFTVTDTEISVILRSKQPSAPILRLYIPDPEEVHTLKLNNIVKTKRNRGVFLSVESELPDN